MRCICIAKIFFAMVISCVGLVPAAFAGDKDLGTNKKILVNIERQILIAVEANKRVFEYDVVTGRPNKETHPGKFDITRKHEDYTSKTYGSEMPYTMFFTKDGKAIHGTKWATVRSYLHAYITESVGSQGCVGLSEEDAREIFKWASVGTSIVILEGREHENERLNAYKRR
jgi:lipoprotein-anchoring transpeptidase ErfK/SrfK